MPARSLRSRVLHPRHENERLLVLNLLAGLGLAAVLVATILESDGGAATDHSRVAPAVPVVETQR